jgi:hypothetical protein
MDKFYFCPCCRVLQPDAKNYRLFEYIERNKYKKYKCRHCEKAFAEQDFEKMSNKKGIYSLKEDYASEEQMAKGVNATIQNIVGDFIKDGKNDDDIKKITKFSKTIITSARKKIREKNKQDFANLTEEQIYERYFKIDNITYQDIINRDINDKDMKDIMCRLIKKALECALSYRKIRLFFHTSHETIAKIKKEYIDDIQVVWDSDCSYAMDALCPRGFLKKRHKERYKAFDDFIANKKSL